MSDNTDDIGLVTEQELCKQLGISAVTVQRMRYEGWGPKFVVLGPRRIAYRPSAISEWLAAREVQQGVAHQVNTNVVAKEGGGRGSDEELIAQLRAENEKLRKSVEIQRAAFMDALNIVEVMRVKLKEARDGRDRQF